MRRSYDGAIWCLLHIDKRDRRHWTNTWSFACRHRIKRTLSNPYHSPNNYILNPATARYRSYSRACWSPSFSLFPEPSTVHYTGAVFTNSVTRNISLTRTGSAPPLTTGDVTFFLSLDPCLLSVVRAPYSVSIETRRKIEPCSCSHSLEFLLFVKSFSDAISNDAQDADKHWQRRSTIFEPSQGFGRQFSYATKSRIRPRCLAPR